MMKITNLMRRISGGFLTREFAGFVLLLFSVCTASAQSTITGKITSKEDGLGLPGASVLVKGTSNSAATDLDGAFSITASANDVLVFSYVGYTPQEIPVGNKTTIDVALTSESTTLNDVVVVGYSTVKKSDITGAVSVVNVADIKKTVSYDVAKMLQGQVAGVSVQSSGEPGGFVNIKIRGITSFGNNNPLFVIDGMIVDNPYDFNPGEIESMQVLKDATAAAIYGVRGANGVVIITTKKGKEGKLTINYKSVVGFQTVPQKLDVTNREQYQQITNASFVNAGRPILPGNDPASEFYINNVDTDWQDAAYKTGIIQNHSLTFSAGSETLNYSMNVDYFKNTSYVDTPQDYQRYSTTMNLGGKKGKFKYGGKLAYTNSDKENFNNYIAGGAGAIINLLQAIPTMPVYDDNRLGGYGGADNLTQQAITLNVIGFNTLNQNSSERARFIGNVWGELEIIKGLRYTLRASADRTDYKNRLFVPPSDLGWYYITTNDEASLDITNGSSVRTIIDNLVNYDFELGKHSFGLLAGNVMEDRKDYSHFTRGVGFEPGEISHLEYANDLNAQERQVHETRLSYLGSLKYSYDDRYFLTANFRNDQSSLFREELNSSNYYGISGAWKLHNDIKLPEWWDTAKIRTGYGTIGNNGVNPYSYTSVVNQFANYTFGNGTAIAPGTTVTQIVDRNIQWEKTNTANVAVELGMLNNKIQFTAEYYIKTTEDIIANIPLPMSSGDVDLVYSTNAAKVRNKGLELTLGYTNNDHAFQYSINANVGTLKNEVLATGGDNLPIYGTNSKTEVGRSLGELYGYVAEGIFQNQADVDAHANQPGAVPGDVKFKDVDGDGLITDDDRTFLGVTIPKVNYGLNFSANYKAFDFSMFWQGNAGNHVYNGTYNSLMIGGLLNHSTDMLNYWTPENTNTNVPRPDFLETNQNARGSSRFVEKGDYIKLQNIQIGYTVPLKDNKFIEKLRVYTSGQNILTLSGYKSYDPDFMNDGLFNRGYDLGSFPNPRTILFGVEVNF
ncbi:TonB-dependent receptor [Flavobacterium zepuense]|uniref:TonB-dependent receptor n=1 Tax=Flavobacterium zepuense TaxID=2593302 RepID=A0A552V2N2_9FLAO|nr:TonB-dependent receptor [Flavobacterium zepuense]TRW24732.1 TonB-dependent receptor [Flavobacterium zepuense]